MGKIFAVRTAGGSMRPSLKGGGYAFVEEVPPETLRPGDAVLYREGDGKYIHRIGRIHREGPRLRHFVIDGDSAVVGRHTVLPVQIEGRVVSRLNGPPGLIWGKTANFAAKFLRWIKRLPGPRFSFRRFFLFLFIAAGGGDLVTLSAATRIKTVEWNFGIGPPAGIHSGTIHAFPTINFRLPDAVSIKKAWLELDGLIETSHALTDADFYFDQAASAVTLRDSFPTATLAYTTGESLRLHIKCEIPESVFSNATASNDYSAAVNLVSGPQAGGAHFNMLALKLYITYGYDDTAPVQVTTVRFPLKSNWASSIASVEGAFAPGTRSLTYNAEIAESGASGFLVKQQWFEIRGHRLSGGVTTDGTIAARIGSNAYAPFLTLDGSLICSYDFLYLTSTGTQPGFQLNTQQTLSVETTQNTVYNLGGECVVTYEFSRDAPTRTKTVYYLLGQGTAAGAVQFPDVSLDLEESGAALRALYARVHGTYNGTSAGNVTWNYSVNNASGPPRVYSHATQSAQVGPHPFFLDLSAPATNWFDGARVRVEYAPSNPANTGPMGAELIATYQFTGSAKFTDSYRTLAYQTTDGVAASITMPFPTFTSSVETPEGRKARNSGYLSGAFLIHQNKSTLITGFSLAQDLNALAAESHFPMTTSEACFVTALYTDPLRLMTTAAATLSAGAGVSANNVFAGGTAVITHSYFPVPDTPAIPAQYAADGATAISTGGWTNGASAALKISLSSRIPDTLTPVFEIKPLVTAFDGGGLATGTPVNYAGTGVVTGSVTVAGLTNGTAYHWRARTASANGSSLWISFGGNAETERDFGVDLSSPAVALAAPLNASTTNQTAIPFQWNGTDYPSPPNSGIANYVFHVSTSADFGVLSYSSNTASSALTVALTQATYYWRARAADGAGNTGDWASYSLMIDTTPPSLPVLTSPLDSAATNQQTISFQWNASDDTGIYGNAGVKGYEFSVSTTSDFSVLASSSFAVAPATSSMLAEGRYYWRVRPLDNAENYGAWTTTRCVFVDGTAPPVPSPVSPLADFATNYALVQFTWSTVDDAATGGSGIGEYELHIASVPDFVPLAFSTATAAAVYAHTLPLPSTYYWRTRARDNAGNASGWSASSYLQFDDAVPGVQRVSVPDSQQSPPLFRAGDPGAFVDIDFYDTPSRLNELTFTVTSEANGGGVTIVPWTLIVSSPVNVPSFTDDWQIPWEPLQEGTTNYVHLYFSDRAGNAGYMYGQFDVLKDTTPPQVPGLIAPAGLSMTNAATIDFDWGDAPDLRSGTSYYLLHLSTSSDFVTIAYSSQAAISGATVSGIAENTYFWRCRAFDRAGNVSLFSSTRSLTVDLSPPSLIIGQSLIGGDTTYRELNTATYDVDFFDTGGAGLDRFELRISTGKAGAPPLLVDWTDSGITGFSGQSSHAADWEFPDTLWQELLTNATNYVSLRAYDLAGNVTMYIDAFFILRATSSVEIKVNEAPGEDAVWRSTSTERAYNVDFFASAEAPLERIQYTAYTLPNFNGAVLFDWTDIPGMAAGGASNTADWQIGETELALLLDGNANFVSVRCWNILGTTVTTRDAFFVKKDTSPPVVPLLSSPLNSGATAQQTVGLSWQAASDLSSGTTLYALEVSTSPEFVPVAFSTFTAATTALTAPLVQCTYYWRAKAKDTAGSWSAYSDGWSIQIDTTPPPAAGLVSPLEGFTTNYVTQGFQWTPVADSGPAGISHYRLDISTTPGFSVIYYSSLAQNTSASAALSLSATYYWRIRAFDRAGNAVDSPSFTVVVDTIVPSRPLLNAPLDTLTTNYTLHTFSWSGTDAGPSQIRDFELQVSTHETFSEIRFSTITPLLFHTTSFVQDAYWWRLRARDNAGNYSLFSSTRNFIVDVSSPQTPALTLPGNDARVNQQALAFAWTPAADPGPAGISNYEMLVSTDPAFSIVHYSSSPVAAACTVTFAGENIFFWKARSRDAAGNYSDFSSTFSVTIDTTPPVIADMQPGDDAWRSTGSTAYGVFFYDEPATAGSGLLSAHYRVFSSTTPSGAPAGTERAGYQSIFTKVLPERTSYYTQAWDVSSSWAGLGEGYNFVFVRSSDMAGNAVEPPAFSFYIKKDTLPPSPGDNETTAVWENANRARDVDFSEGGSGVTIASYTVFSGPLKTGTTIVPWTAIFDTSPPVALWDADWLVDFDLLSPGTNYISVRAADYVGTVVSSADVFVILKDTIPPDAVGNLFVSTGATAGSLGLRWSAPSDDILTEPGYLTVKNYLVKYKTTPFSGIADFLANGTTFSNLWSPAPPGTPEQQAIDGLVEGTTYYVAIAARDKAGNIAPLASGSTHYAYAARVAPAKITTLAGSSPDTIDPGSVELSWIAVGNSGTEGAASGYVVKYATYSFGESQWNAVSEYAQVWPPAAAGAPESYVLSGFTPGTTYYFAMKAFDAASPGANYSVMSDIVTVQSRPAGPADGILCYGQGTAAAPTFYRTTAAGATWTGPFSANAAAGTIRWSVLRACPLVRNEKLFATLSSNGALYVQRRYWDEASQNELWGSAELQATIASADTVYRPYDVAYEQTTGRALVAYRSSSGGQIFYRVWSSTAAAWLNTATALNVGGTGLVRWVRLEPRAGTNELMLVTLDANGHLYAWRWNGASWTNGSLLTQSAFTSAYQDIDAAWENARGNCLILWGEGRTTKYAMWSSSAAAWARIGSQGPDIATSPNNGADWIRLAADRLSGSNNIAMASLDTNADWNVAVWDGASWGSLNELSGNMDSYATRLIDIAWEKDTGECLAVGVISGQPYSVSYSAWSPSSGWSGLATDGFNLGGNVNLKWLQLTADPNSNRMVLTGVNGGADGSVSLKTVNWTGKGWAGGVGIAANGSAGAFEFFALALNRYDTILPWYNLSQTGDDTWRSVNNGLYSTGFFDNGGSLLAKVQTRLATASGGAGEYRAWTNELMGLNADEYTTPWPLQQATWNQLKSGKTYVSLRVFDGVGNQVEFPDAFYVLKDTQPPSLSNYYRLSNGWYTGAPAGNVAHTDAADQAALSLLATAYYIIHPQPARGGSEICRGVAFDISAVPQSSYSGDFGLAPGHWELLPNSTNYASLLCYDVAGNSATVVDAFVIWKDTIPPQAITTLDAAPGPYRGTVDLSWIAPGDDGFMKANGEGGYRIKLATYPVTDALFEAASTYAQTLVPGPPRSRETITLIGLSPDTTYYFAVKTKDKAPLWSGVSNSTGTLPRSENVYINEVYAAGPPGADWVELYSNIPAAQPLSGWALVYNQGSIASPGAESTAWTGGGADTISSGTFRLVSSLDLNGAASHHLKLRDNLGRLVDIVQWPACAPGQSFARISDGNSQFLEIDPTPTGGYANSVATGAVKVNEVDYTSSQQFIELYNTAFDTFTLAGWSLRNSNKILFAFTRKIYPRSFTGIDFSSVDNAGGSWTARFGAGGLAPTADFLALENEAGQTVDRVTWRSGSNASYLDYRATPAVFNTPAPGGLAAPQTIGRGPQEGTDTLTNSADFTAFAAPSYGARNNGTPAAANTLSYPSSDSYLPRTFKISLTLGENSLGGRNNTLWLVRTGGAADNVSPHIYRLEDAGFDTGAPLTAQTTVQFGAAWKDIDGNSLVPDAVYKLSLNSDNGSQAAPQIIRNNITYDTSVHQLRVGSIVAPYFNDGAKHPLFRIDVVNNSPAGGNAIEFSSVAVRFTTAADVPLTTEEARSLFAAVFLVGDNPLAGTQGAYQADIDTATLVSVSSAAFSLDVNGAQVIGVTNADAPEARVPARSTSTFMLGVRLSGTASSASPNTFKAKIVPGGAETLLRDGPSDVVQSLPAGAETVTSTPTIIVPAPPPAGTVFPVPVVPAGTELSGALQLNAGGDTAFAGAGDGKVYALRSDGTPKWTYDAGSPVVSAYDAGYWEASSYTYLATQSGMLYKIRDDGSAANDQVPGWESPKNLGSAVTSDIYGTGDYIYVGTTNGAFHKINKNGTYTGGWSNSTEITGEISGAPIINNFGGINKVWLVTGVGGVFCLNDSVGTADGQTAVPAAIRTSPFMIDGTTNPEKNKQYVYWGGDDGILRCRNAVNLTTQPSDWADLSVSSPIRSSPVYDWDRYVYFGADNGKFYKIDYSSGGIYWTFSTRGPVRTMPVLGNNSDVYFGSDDGYLYGLDTVTGQLISNNFPVVTGGEIRSLLFDGGYSGHHPTEDYIYFSSNDGKMYCIRVWPR